MMLPLIEGASGALAGASSASMAASAVATEALGSGAIMTTSTIRSAGPRVMGAGAGLLAGGIRAMLDNTANTVGDVPVPHSEVSKEPVTAGVFADTTDDVTIGRAPTLNDNYVSADADVVRFLQQPVQIRSFTWDSGGSVAAFNPWSLWAADLAVQRKIANFHYLEGKLRVKFVTNGNAYQYGRLTFGYLPRPSTDPYRAQTLGLTGYAVSNLPLQVNINPSSDSVIEIELPWTNQYPAIVAGAGTLVNEVSNIGSFQPFVAASLATTSTGLLSPYVDVTVFASMHDLKLSFKTSIIPASDYKGTLSKPLGTLARLASNITAVPIIGRYATATSVAARGAAELATLFGFSAPNNIEPIPLTHIRNTGQMTQTIIPDAGVVLATDPKVETTIDPSLLGLPPDDELSYASILKKYSMVCKTPWDNTQAIDTVVYNKQCSPFLTDQTMPYSPSHVSYLCMAHKGYRGSIKLRIVIPCTVFHTGRLQFTFEPSQTTLVGTGLNTNLSVIYDLASMKELVIDIPYTPRSYFNTIRTYIGDTTNLILNNSYGKLTAKVISALRAGGVATTVQILTYLCAGDDFEVTIPSFEWWRNATNRMGYFPAATVTVVAANTALGGYYPTDTPPSLLAVEEEVVEDEGELIPASLEVVSSGEQVEIGTTAPLVTANFALLNSSEKFVSWRNLIKRYCYYQTITLEGAYNAGRAINYFVCPPGYVRNIAGGVYNNDNQVVGYHPLSYLAPCFVGRRGSMRHMVFPNLRSFSYYNLVGTRLNLPANLNSVFMNNTPNSIVFNTMCSGGDIVTSQGANTPLRITLPHVWPFSYIANEEVDPYRTNVEPCWLYSAASNAAQQNVHTHFVAAGDDFTFLFYRGPPVLFNVVLA